LIQALAKQAALRENVRLQEHQGRVRDRVTGGDRRLLLYHGLGSGKSLSSLAAAEAAGGPYAAVTPASLKPNYEKEIAKFTEGSRPEVLSYTGLGMGKQPEQDPETLIFDEAHRLRNPGTASSRAATQLARKAKNVMLLTGTPVTNSPGDLAGLLSVLNDQPIDPEEFEQRFVGHKKVYPTWLSRLTGRGVGEEAHLKNEAQLRKLVRGKVDYQPSKTPQGVSVDEQTIRVPLTRDQQRIQKAIRSQIPLGWSWKLDREFPLTRPELSSLNSFLTGLRQSSLSTLPFRADKDPLRAFADSGKLQRAMTDLRGELDSDPRKKSLVYSNYIDAGLKPYAAALQQAGIPHGMYHGSMPLQARRKALDDYNAGKIRTLLLGPAAAEGISTQGTNLIQLLDPHWHESRSSQARGRGLRFDSHDGLPEDLKNVAVRRYISESRDPSLLRRLLGARRERTGDEILETLSSRKERLNDQFRKVLQEEGRPDETRSDR
jgi:superfamily II DNA or RNA helicase